MKKALILAAAMACSLSAFADFKAGMSQADINKEVANQVASNKTMAQIATAAKNAGVEVNPVALALSFYGSHEAVLAAMMTAGYPASAVVNTLVSLGGSREALAQAAVRNNPSVDPTSLLASTAAGSTNTGAAVSVSNFSGFSSTGFNTYRAPVVSGGVTRTNNNRPVSPS